MISRASAGKTIFLIFVCVKCVKKNFLTFFLNDYKKAIGLTFRRAGKDENQHWHWTYNHVCDQHPRGKKFKNFGFLIVVPNAVYCCNWKYWYSVI